jgi:hypothetical protein
MALFIITRFDRSIGVDVPPQFFARMDGNYLF